MKHDFCSVAIAPDVCSHEVEFYVVNTVGEAREIIPDFGDDFCGCCEYDHSPDTDLKAKVVMLSEHLDAALLAHECTHAALEWVCYESMPAVPNDLPEEEMQAYFREAVCRVVEQLMVGAMVLVNRKEQL